LITRKQRESDIISKKSYTVTTAFRNGPVENLLIRLFVQCKFVEPQVELYFVSKNLSAANELAKDNNVLRGSEDFSLRNTSVVPPQIHHYVEENEVAKSWKCRPDIIHDACQQALHSFLYFNHHLYEDPYTVDFPVIVVNSFDRFFRRDWKTKTLMPITENFQIAVDYAYPEFPSLNEKSIVKRYFLIDVVSFDRIDDFLEKLEEHDIELLRHKLWWHLESRARKRISDSRPRHW
jgi:hypothetical protein